MLNSIGITLESNYRTSNYITYKPPLYPEGGFFQEVILLKYLVLVTKQTFMIFVVMSFFVLYLKRAKNKYLYIGSAVLLFASLVSGIYMFVIRYLDAKAVNIALIMTNRYLILTVFIFAFLAFIFSFLKKKEIFISLLGISLAASISYLLPQILQYTQEFVYFGEDSVSTMALLRLIGFTFGFIVSFLAYLSIYSLMKKVNDKLYYLMFRVMILIYAFSYFLKAVAAAQRLKLIKLSDFIFQIMIFGDKYEDIGIYLMSAVTFILAIYIISTNRKVVGTFKNNALRRKEKARLRNKRRWSYSLASFALAALLIVTLVHYYDTKPVPLAEPQEYEVEGDKIVIPLTDFEDGKLHRYAYTTPNGITVKFIGVKKPGVTAYGLGLDACEICGVAGYFERGDDVVCKRCDVVMNKATIGFKGGCNPIPFPYNIENEKIYINMKDLEREEKRFK